MILVMAAAVGLGLAQRRCHNYVGGNLYAICLYLYWSATVELRAASGSVLLQ
jgi:hypothetical protein